MSPNIRNAPINRFDVQVVYPDHRWSEISRRNPPLTRAEVADALQEMVNRIRADEARLAARTAALP